MYGLGSFFIGNQLHSALLSTGAFEIYINDVLAYSKIQMGKMPDMNVIQQVFAQHGIPLA
jgi:selT/selW/selH-like putative selenoprotein